MLHLARKVLSLTQVIDMEKSVVINSVIAKSVLCFTLLFCNSLMEYSENDDDVLMN